LSSSSYKRIYLINNKSGGKIKTKAVAMTTDALRQEQPIISLIHSVPIRGGEKDGFNESQNGNKPSNMPCKISDVAGLLLKVLIKWHLSDALKNPARGP
jgi:hypothetical protein